MICNNAFRNQLTDEYFNTLKMYHSVFSTHKLFSSNEDLCAKLLSRERNLSARCRLKGSLSVILVPRSHRIGNVLPP